MEVWELTVPVWALQVLLVYAGFKITESAFGLLIKYNQHRNYQKNLEAIQAWFATHQRAPLNTHIMNEEQD